MQIYDVTFVYNLFLLLNRVVKLYLYILIEYFEFVRKIIFIFIFNDFELYHSQSMGVLII